MNEHEEYFHSDHPTPIRVPGSAIACWHMWEVCIFPLTNYAHMLNRDIDYHRAKIKADPDSHELAHHSLCLLQSEEALAAL